MDNDLRRILEGLSNTVDQLKRQIGQLNERDLKDQLKNNMQLLGSGINQAMIREMFILEILREKGLLEGVDLDAIAEKARARHVERATWVGSKSRAEENLNFVLAEITGEKTGPGQA
ncbi:hypothetical protein QBK99_10935 [Corticibacterium sp. UT-5YL-CI-8]|nr:hypothetical protein [Tianweitania sp. UT-5YL-CI-8]